MYWPRANRTDPCLASEIRKERMHFREGERCGGFRRDANVMTSTRENILPLLEPLSWNLKGHKEARNTFSSSSCFSLGKSRMAKGRSSDCRWCIQATLTLSRIALSTNPPSVETDLASPTLYGFLGAEPRSSLSQNGPYLSFHWTTAPFLYVTVCVLAIITRSMLLKSETM